MFLFRFLPLALLAYFLAPRFLKNGVLLLASLIFYAWGEPRYIVIMFLSIVVDYIASNGIEKKPQYKKWFLALSVAMNMGLLMGFKYLDFFITNANHFGGLNLPLLNLTLPLGISFYTFQTMSYTIDVYRGKVEAETNIIDFGAYVCLFPQLIAGPIVKYVDIHRELKQRRVVLDQITVGVRYFVMGLASKVLIANPIGLLWHDVQALGVQGISTPMAWLGILAFAFQIYFDFSGYSLMAIGLGKILGFEFPQNFDFPYMSRSVTEFWRRWHMTLGGWFREYVYIPLGGNRKRQGLNLLVVWFLTGFWHGAGWHFIIWGLYFALFLVIEKRHLDWLGRHPKLASVYALFVVLMGWVFFSANGLGDALLYFKRLFTWHFSSDFLYALRQYGTTFVMAAFFSTPWIKRFYERNKHHQVVMTLGLLGIFLISVAYLVDATFNPFLYFRF